MTLVAKKEEGKAEDDIRSHEGMEAKVLVLVVGATHLYEFKFWKKNWPVLYVSLKHDIATVY